MHELSIAQALVEQIEAIVRGHDAQYAIAVRIRIGPLSGVVPELLANVFPLAAAGTVAESARLDLLDAPIRVRCESCGAESKASASRLLCATCGDWHTQVIAGDELILESVELEMHKVKENV